MQIGHYKDEKIFLHVPTHPVAELEVRENTQRNADTQPDLKLYYKELEVGALWNKQSQKGHPYTTGHFYIYDRKIQIVIFKTQNGGVVRIADKVDKKESPKPFGVYSEESEF
jgi:uncharacterized protein (DUF736 family)